MVAVVARSHSLPIIASATHNDSSSFTRRHFIGTATFISISLSNTSKAAEDGRSVNQLFELAIGQTTFMIDKHFNYEFNSIRSDEKSATLSYIADAGNTRRRSPESLGGSRSSYTEERPRFFDSKVKKTCWDKAKQVPGRDPERWRIDAAGNVVCKRLHTCQGCLCFEYDHIVPFARGGESVEDNCQILQTRVNRLKSDKNGVDQRSLKGYSCDIKFSDEQLDIIEMAVYGSVVRPGKQCIVGNVDAILGRNKLKNHVMRCSIQ